jgi:hypothetical protein
MTRTPAPILATLALASASLATPLDPSWAPDDASWLVHVDVDQLMRSRLVESMLGEGRTVADMIHDEVDIEFEELEEIDEAFPRELMHAWMNRNLDLERDLHAITIFGRLDRNEPDGFILETSVAIDQIVAQMQPIDEVEAVQGRNLTIVAIESDEARAHDADDGEWTRLIAAIVPNPATAGRTVVMGESIEQIVSTLDRHTRRAPLRQGPAWADPSPGTMLFMYADPRIADLGDAGGHAHLVRKARSVLVEYGELGDELFATVEIEAAQAADAQNMMAVGQGMLAMGRLVLAGEPEMQAVLPLLNGLRLETDAAGTTVRATFRMDTARFAETVRALEGFDHDHVHHDHRRQGDGSGDDHGNDD